MRTALGQQLATLADTVHAPATPDPAELWKAGRRRRRWAAARSILLLAVALLSLGLVALPVGYTAPTPPASPPAGVETPTYPSVIAEPVFPPTALEAHRSMAAVYLADQRLLAVDDHGNTWKAPKSATRLTNASLSPDGRYAVDGATVYDFVDGASTRLTGLDRLPSEYARIGAGWSPDSRHYAVIADSGTQAKVGIGTPGGRFELTPDLPGGDTSDITTVRTAWLDNTRLLLLVPAAPTPADATRGSSLTAFSWTLGDTSWRRVGALQLPPNTALEYLGSYVTTVSPDRRTVALAALVEGRGDALLTWPMPSNPKQTTTGATVVAPSVLGIDGVTWHGRELVVSRGGMTRVLRTGQVLSEAGGATGHPISWRADVFDGVPYYNTAAVWRHRLFVWTFLLGSIVIIALGLRLARPIARRAGLINRYASPFPIEARWIFSR